MTRRITFQWIEGCTNERLLLAQQRLLESCEQFGIEPDLFCAGPDLVKFGDILSHARRNASGDHFVWCNSDVILTRDPFDVADPSRVHGFHRTERPSGDLCLGVDMYLVPVAIWDDVLAADVPDLWCGAAGIDWWLTRACQLRGIFRRHTGFIDHPSHERTAASRGGDRYFRHNVKAYNRWARRAGAGIFDTAIELPLVGPSTSPLTDYLGLCAGRRAEPHR